MPATAPPKVGFLWPLGSGNPGNDAALAALLTQSTHPSVTQPR